INGAAAFVGFYVMDRRYGVSWVQGYDSTVVGVILISAAAGIITSMVMKYIDTMAKMLTGAISVITTGLLAFWVFDTSPFGVQFFGAFAVMVLALFIYYKTRLTSSFDTM